MNMNTSKNAKDDVSDILRAFYAAFGVAGEGPPTELNVSMLPFTHAIPAHEYEPLRKTLRDHSLLREFRRCRTILDDLATRLTSKELLRELSMIPTVSERQFEELSNGVFWFSLAASTDVGQRPPAANPFGSETVDLPPMIKAKLTVEGPLILRLYVALVYIREGVLKGLIGQGVRAGGQCCKQVDRLLRCDYVRRIRNGLAHGSFSSCVAGIVFRDINDSGKTLVATPGFLSQLGTWLMLIQLQALAACAELVNKEVQR
jgi:hypothetical protein